MNQDFDLASVLGNLDETSIEEMKEPEVEKIIVKLSTTTPTSNDKRACVRKLIDCVTTIYEPILKTHSQQTYSKLNLEEKDAQLVASFHELTTKHFSLILSKGQTASLFGSVI